MDNEKISSFLQTQRDSAPEDLQHYFLTFEDYWERKLWHELTDILVTYYEEPQSAASRIPVYENFIKSFADRINQLKLVKIGLRAAAQYGSMLPRLIHIYGASLNANMLMCFQMTKSDLTSSKLSQPE